MYPRLISDAWLAHLDTVGYKQHFMEGARGEGQNLLERMHSFHYNCDIALKSLIRNAF